MFLNHVGEPAEEGKGFELRFKRVTAKGTIYAL
jgi:hypothetical protein